jgi:hypothetical protein
VVVGVFQGSGIREGTVTRTTKRDKDHVLEGRINI